MKNTKDSIALRHVKKIMSHKNEYLSGKYNSTALMIMSLVAVLCGITAGVLIQGVGAKCIWFLFSGIQFANFMKQLLVKGFIEFIEEKDK
jgi:hypothetical protein